MFLAPSVAAFASAGPGPLSWEVSDSSGGWSWPLDPRPPVIRTFEPPADVWGSGHRGVDLGGRVGQPVLVIAAGTVTFAGTIAERGVVVVNHGSLRSTYEPVTATVEVGDEVVVGQAVGLLQSVQSHCLPAVCLHLGVRQERVYLDPLTLFGPRMVRLKPVSDPGGSFSTVSTQLSSQQPFDPTVEMVAPREARRRDSRPTSSLPRPRSELVHTATEAAADQPGRSRSQLKGRPTTQVLVGGGAALGLAVVIANRPRRRQARG